MSHARPIPEANQSPYPIQEPPHADIPDAGDAVTPVATNDAAEDVMAKAKETIAPLAEKARTFAKARPYATAALVGTVALALFNTLRGKRVG